MQKMRRFIIVSLILFLVLSVPWAYAQETYAGRSEFDAGQFTLGLLMEGAWIYVFCLTWIEAEEKDDKVELKWGYAVLGSLMMLTGASWMANAWTARVEKVSRGSDERTYLMISRRF